ncbi:hypothetical protein AB0D59_02155 [Streptomyces sp. NPDC048417]|uniref:hypothetical protein n=1 Tax=Streptomyces sp. NPDC048417 TaxID=3155387 RepID=UPI0034195DEB
MRAAGEVPLGAVAVGEVAVGCGEFGAGGSDRRGRVPSWREEADDGVGAEVADPAAAAGRPSWAAGEPRVAPAGEPSSGTSVTDPVGLDDVPGAPGAVPAAPTAV